MLLLALASGCGPKAATVRGPQPPMTPGRVARGDVVAPASGGTERRGITDASKVAEETLLLGRSVEGRPITLHVLGSGDEHVLILAGFHGNEPGGTELAEALLAWLRANPGVCDGRQVAIAPAVNPDGLLRSERTNADHVDINRNFPASNWSRDRGGRDVRGRGPGGEPETQAVIVAVHLIEPVRILSIHSIERGGQCNNYDGPAAALAQAMSTRNGYPARPKMGYDTPGSFGTWAGIDRHIPTITLELPRELRGEPCWRANREALLAFIAGG